MTQQNDSPAGDIVRHIKIHGLFAFYTLSIALFFFMDNQRLHRSIIYAVIGLWAVSKLRVFLQHIKHGNIWQAVKNRHLVIIILLYMAWQAVSLLWSPVFSGEEFMEILRKSLLILLFIAMTSAMLQSERYMKFFWWSFIFSAAAAAISSVLLFWYEPSQIEQLTGRLVGIGRAENPIQAAALFGIALIGAGYFILRENNISKRAILIACWLSLLLAMLLTQSRGALLSAAIGHIVLLWQYGSGRRVLFYSLFAALLLLGLTASWVDWAGMFSRADSFRFLIWQHALADWIDKPVLGLGFRAPFFVTLPYGHEISQPHSIYVGALYYGGVVGLALLLSMFGYAGLKLWQNRSVSSVVLFLALWINGVIFALVDFDLLVVSADVEWILFWFPVAGAMLHQPNQAQQLAGK